MKHIYSLPSATGRDIVTEIERKKAATKRRENATRCFDSNSCDCPRCSGRS